MLFQMVNFNLSIVFKIVAMNFYTPVVTKKLVIKYATNSQFLVPSVLNFCF